MCEGRTVLICVLLEDCEDFDVKSGLYRIVYNFRERRRIVFGDFGTPTHFETKPLPIDVEEK